MLETRKRHLRFALLALVLAAPVEVVNVFLTGMMFDPGPHSTILGMQLLEWQWAFFHFLGFYCLDGVHRLLGTEYRAIIAAYLIAYLQTAVVLFIAALSGLRLLRTPKKPERSSRGIRPHVPAQL